MKGSLLTFLVILLIVPPRMDLDAKAQAPNGAEADLAQQLQNPISGLISVPFQNNYDCGFGREEGCRYTLNIQPVIPFSLNQDWNLISRTIVPFISQNDVIGRSDQSGLGDTTQSFFFSPKKPTSGGLIWGAGPVVVLPTATGDLLGAEKWGAGPTIVLLKQAGGWTVGILANHIWSFAGDDDRDDISATFFQPFLSYTTPASTTFGVNTEATYDWSNTDWMVPVNAFVSQLLKIGTLPVSLTLGGRYFTEMPSGDPDWGARFVLTLLFPKKK